MSKIILFTLLVYIYSAHLRFHLTFRKLFYSTYKCYVFFIQGPSSSPLHKPMLNRTKPTVAKGTLRGVDPKLAQLVLDEVLEGGPPVQWEDIAGQDVCMISYFNLLGAISNQIKCAVTNCCKFSNTM